jgi:hypothetical protein
MCGARIPNPPEKGKRKVSPTLISESIHEENASLSLLLRLDLDPFPFSLTFTFSASSVSLGDEDNSPSFVIRAHSQPEIVLGDSAPNFERVKLRVKGLTFTFLFGTRKNTQRTQGRLRQGMM